MNYVTHQAKVSESFKLSATQLQKIHY